MVSTEMVLNVFGDSDAGDVLSVGPDLDGLGCLRIFNPSEDSKAFFGKVDFIFTTDFAKALGTAIVRVAEEIEKAAK